MTVRKTHSTVWIRSDSKVSTASISGDLIGHVRTCMDLSLDYIGSGRGVFNATNAFTPHAFPSYVCATASVEAFVNEQMIGQLAQAVLRDSPLWSLLEDGSLEKMDLLPKIVIVPQVLFGKSFRRDAQPFQDFRVLVRVRNDLVHFKMGMEPPKYLRLLAQRGIALTAPSASEGADYDWPHKLSSTEGIRWAHNTACRVVNELVQFIPDEHRKIIIGAMAENYREISDSEIREWMTKACHERSVRDAQRNP